MWKRMRDPKTPGFVLVVSGPSGAGKSTVIQHLMTRRDTLPLPICFSVSATTRAPRPGETDGVNYRFLSREEFEAGIERGEFLEHAEYAGNLYGTPLGPVKDALAEGTCIFMDIEVQGAMQVRSRLPEAILVFLMPPTLTELERRLRGRQSEKEEMISRRMAIVEGEIASAHEYDYIVVNDAVEKAALELESIVRAEYCRNRR